MTKKFGYICLLMAWLCFNPLMIWAQTETSDSRVTTIKDLIESILKQFGGAIVVGIIVFIILFLIVRELLCWYWKTNEIISTLKDISDKLNKPSEVNKQSSELPAQKVPDCISFGKEVLLIPTLAEAGIPQSLGYLGVFETHVKLGDWVNRGDKLLTANFYVFRADRRPRWPFSDEFVPRSISLESPVSGMIIDFREEYVADRGMAHTTATHIEIAYRRKFILPVILLPNDEPPQNVYKLEFYREMRGVLGSYKGNLLFSPPHESGYIRLTEAMSDFSEEKRGEIENAYRDLGNRDLNLDLESFEVKQILTIDEKTLSQVQQLRAYNLELRDKLLHLVRKS